MFGGTYRTWQVAMGSVDGDGGGGGADVGHLALVRVRVREERPVRWWGEPRALRLGRRLVVPRAALEELLCGTRCRPLGRRPVVTRITSGSLGCYPTGRKSIRSGSGSGPPSAVPSTRPETQHPIEGCAAKPAVGSGCGIAGSSGGGSGWRVRRG